VARTDVVFILLDEKGEVIIGREKRIRQGSFVAEKSLSISLYKGRYLERGKGDEGSNPTAAYQLW